MTPSAASPVSRTALTAAAARAAHPLVDAPPFVHVDPLAAVLLGDAAEELIAYHRRHGDHPVLAGARAQVVCRSRFTEDRVTAAAARGVDQYVVLAAGLDSFAYRRPADLSPLTVFEVDRPPTPQWKRERLAAAGVTVSDDVRNVPVDLAADDVVRHLADHGLDLARPAVVSWLGGTMYLTRDAVGRTLTALAGLAPGTEVIFDYLVPARLQDDAGRLYAEAVAPMAAEQGEPWLGLLAPTEVVELIIAAGLDALTDVDQRGAVPDALWTGRRDSLRPGRLQRLVVAQVPAG